MQFVSFGFLLFTAGLLILYYTIASKGQWIFLLAASYLFYLFAGLKYLVFILFTTLTTYTAAIIMDRNLFKISQLPREERKAHKADVKKKNRTYMLLCLTVNFAILAFCKFRFSFRNIALPMGISFYMFQSMGYVIDVYRGTVRAEGNIFQLALFVSYFPQLVQGPISRFSQLAPELYRPHKYDGKELSFGLQRMLWGYFKKMVVADRIAVAIGALKGPEDMGVSFLVLTVFYAIQIYGDFTGGIDMTIGLAEAMGIELPENFIRPYFSKNIAEYWRRWHASLGVWMKDYIFYPISVSQPMLKLSKTARAKFGNFGKRLPVYVASVATWFCTGIWHGLTPNFVVWGMLNCFVIMVSEELAPLYEKFHDRFHLKDKGWYGVFEMLRMFMLMNLIRACDLFPNVGDYFVRLGSLFTTFNFHVLWDGTMMNLGLTGLDYGILAFAIVVMFAVSLFQEKKGSVREALWGKPVLRYVLVFALFVAVLLLGSYGIGYNASNFIYDNF